MSTSVAEPRTVAGHPPGLFVLFFAEMWERFSYYGMRALLVFYMIKGFLAYDDGRAYAVYGAYTALVYATPFIGGLLADRLLGARRAVIIGGLLMAAGHLVMSVENEAAFFVALSLLIIGNGFFKPNISTIVGSLYPPGSTKRDGGFTLFYMGINLGAAMSPLLCGYIGETYGWHYGFGLATIGMLAGLAVFVAPTALTRLFIGGGALTAAIGLIVVGRGDPILLALHAFIATALLVAAVVAVVATTRGSLPPDVGQPKDPARLAEPVLPALPWLSRNLAVYLGIVVAVPVIALLVTRSAAAGVVLVIFGGLALLSLVATAFKSEKIERERLFVVLILTFFSMLFWSFFEQAGSSINNFTDRNVDRVVGARTLTEADVGTSLENVTPTQAFLGFSIDGKPQTLTDIEAQQRKGPIENLQVDDSLIGLKIGGTEIKASVFQAANPIYIILFGLVFSWLWGFLGRRKLEPSTPVKFGLGLLQLGLGFAALWYGATHADERGMVAMGWLLLGYLLHTTGELCLSPVGLSMVTKLSPARMVSTVMGAWFLATAFSNYLAGIIAALTGVTSTDDATGMQSIPLPSETVNVYGEVFGQIAVAAVLSSFVMFALAPLLTKWMHTEVDAQEQGSDGGHEQAA